MSNELDEALSNPLKRAKMAKNVLSSIFWKAIEYYDINYKKWSASMRNYTTNVYNVPEQMVARRGEAKNNLTSALLHPMPTFMQFMRGMKFLDIRKMHITVKLYRGDKMEEVVIEETVIFPNNNGGANANNEKVD